MAQQLKNTLSFANLAPGASVSIPHLLKDSGGRPLAPDVISVLDGLAVSATADSVNVTVINESGQPVTGAVLVEAWHTIERAFGGVQNLNLPVKPFLVGGIGSALDTKPVAAFVFRPGATGADAPGGNVYTDWPTLMAALDATRHLGLRVLQFDSTFQTPAPIPAGEWNMTQVRWYGISTFVEIQDGAHFVWDSVAVGNPLEHVIEGFLFVISYNGTGPITPFDQDITILCTGNNVRFANQNALAKPMFKADNFGVILFSGENTNGGFQDYPSGTLAAPILDCNGAGFYIFGGAGVIANGFATDSVGGGAIFGSAIGIYGDLRDQWSAPALLAAGGIVAMDENRPSSRYRINPDFAGVPVAAGPYAAAYNEFVPVDTTLGPITVNLPKAGVGGVTNASYGERVTIKDVGLSLTPPGTGAGTNPITIASTYGDTIDGTGIINTDGGSMTFVCWGYGIWSQV